MAMSVFMFHGFIRGSIPLALEEAAYIDGCTHTQTFFRIVFPLLKADHFHHGNHECDGILE